MPEPSDPHHRRLVERLTDAFVAEAAERDPEAAVPWTDWPTAGAVVDHVGGVHRWAARALAAGDAPPGRVPERPAGLDRIGWCTDGRRALLDALAAVRPDAPCWVLGGGSGTAAFWSRRMVFETAKHLADLRASGGGTWRTPEELTAADALDGVDEVLTAFLQRARPRLAALPGSVALEATDAPRSWVLSSDWRPLPASAIPDCRIRAAAADLLLLVWERADPLRFAVDGRPAVATAFARAAITL